MYYEYYIMGLILIPGIILSIYASIKVNVTFNRYNEILSRNGNTADIIARNVLNQAGLTNISIVRTRGHLTDYYHPKKKLIALSNSVYGNSSISAIGVALHEVGHALQYKNNYLPIKIRNLIIPICNFANRFLWISILIGGIFYYTPLGQIFLWIGVGIFALSVLFNLVTLPIEFDASRRAIKILSATGELDEEELYGAKKVLNSAGLTYVAGLVVSILNLLRLLLVVLDKKD
ncbi:MAG: zinc metallopeptidase [Clostridiales bacterium]|nr:zinc metallopeptidase [Clostridiales bacterium]